MGKKNQVIVATPTGVEPQKMLPTAPVQQNEMIALTPEMLISQGIKQGLSVDTMERLLGMRRELNAEKAREAFNDAMAAFQSECPVIKKNKGVPLKSGLVAYKYAPLDAIVTQTKALIAKHGFRYSTSMEMLESGVRVVCRVMHKLGHVEETPMHVPLGTKTDIMSHTQQIAAAQTFAKRYAFCNAFGIMTGDTDNDAALPPGTDDKPPKGESKQDPEVIKKFIGTATLKQCEEIMKKIKGSDKYTAAQKKEITDLVDARMKTLPDGYPVK